MEIEVASVTIRNIDEDVKRRLKLRAAKGGRSLEHDLRLVLIARAEEEVPAPRSQAEIKRRFDAIMALGQPPLEPFDLKAASDELYDYLP